MSRYIRLTAEILGTFFGVCSLLIGLVGAETRKVAVDLLVLPVRSVLSGEIDTLPASLLSVSVKEEILGTLWRPSGTE